MTQTEILKNIISTGIIPVFNHENPDTAKRVIKACYDSGLRVFEWTNRGEKAFRVFSEIISYVKDSMPDMLIGAGSIFNANMARNYVAKGARFIVSPVIDPDLAEACKKLEVPWIPGTGTATEIHQAEKWGAGIIKVFPGESVGGPGFIKAVLGPMPWLQLMPTGGVSPTRENLKEWFDAGVCCVGMGSKLFTREMVDKDDPADLMDGIRKVLDIIHNLKNTE